MPGAIPGLALAVVYLDFVHLHSGAGGDKVVVATAVILPLCSELPKATPVSGVRR